MKPFNPILYELETAQAIRPTKCHLVAERDRCGGPEFLEVTRRGRAFLDAGDKAGYDQLKKEMLPALVPSARLIKGRTASHCSGHTGVVVADIDAKHLRGADPRAMRDRVFEECPEVVWSKLSVSGRAIHAFFRVGGRLPKRLHLSAFGAVEKIIRERFGFEIDPQFKSIVQPLFLSHDPDQKYRENPSILHVPGSGIWTEEDEMESAKAVIFARAERLAQIAKRHPDDTTQTNWAINQVLVFNHTQQPWEVVRHGVETFLARVQTAKSASCYLEYAERIWRKFRDGTYRKFSLNRVRDFIGMTLGQIQWEYQPDRITKAPPEECVAAKGQRVAKETVMKLWYALSRYSLSQSKTVFFFSIRDVRDGLGCDYKSAWGSIATLKRIGVLSVHSMPKTYGEAITYEFHRNLLVRSGPPFPLHPFSHHSSLTEDTVMGKGLEEEGELPP